MARETLLLLFKEGKSEAEAHEAISKSHSSYSISLKLVSYWFEKFRSGDDLVEKKRHGRRPKFTDEYLINLIEENPGLNTIELAKLADTSKQNISYRILKINKDRSDGNMITLKDGSFKPRKSKNMLTDEFLINLVNENPELNMKELAKLGNVSVSYISIRLKQMKNEGKIANYVDKKSQIGTMELTEASLINMIKENPDFSTRELAKLANSSQSTIVQRLKRIDNGKEKVDYVNKNFKRAPKKFTDEFLISLIKENPELNMIELGKLAGVSSNAISARLRKINSDGEKVTYIKRTPTGRPKKYTDEFLINLVNENPGLNYSELAKLANASPLTIKKRLQAIDTHSEKSKNEDK
jgi:transposase